MKSLLLAALLVLLTGCHDEQIVVPPKQTVIATKCPKFNTKLKIKVNDLNSTHGSISWSDVSKIESFLKSKSKFNSNIDTLNQE